MANVPPTFLSRTQTVYGTTTTPKTASVSVNAQDTLVVIGVTGNNLTTIGTPSDGANTYTLQQSVVVTDFCWLGIWTVASCASTASLTVSATRGGSGGDLWGFNVARFSGVSAIGASSKTNVSSGAPSLGITTQADNSVLVAGIGDWTASAISGRTWRTVNGFTPASPTTSGEMTADQETGIYSIFGAWWGDAGTAGAKTVGMTAPSGQKYSIAAVELKGFAAAGDGPRWGIYA